MGAACRVATTQCSRDASSVTLPVTSCRAGVSLPLPQALTDEQEAGMKGVCEAVKADGLHKIQGTV